MGVVRLMDVANQERGDGWKDMMKLSGEMTELGMERGKCDWSGVFAGVFFFFYRGQEMEELMS